MPIYLYQCISCNYEMEYFAKNASDSPSRCTECDSVDITRKFDSQTFGIPSANNSIYKGPHSELIFPNAIVVAGPGTSLFGPFDSVQEVKDHEIRYKSRN